MEQHSPEDQPALPKIAYLLNSFPALSETFILQEILELERQGLGLHLFTLSPAHKQPEDAWKGQVPMIALVHRSRSVLVGAALRRLLRSPWRFLQTALTLLTRYQLRPGLMVLLYASALANHLEQRGINAIHAHYATEPAAIAQATYLLTSIPYSFTAHAYDIYLSPKPLLASKMQTARFVVTCTAYNRRYLTEIEPGLSKHIHCIYHGINLSMFANHKGADVSCRPEIAPNGDLAGKDDHCQGEVGRLVDISGRHDTSAPLWSPTSPNMIPPLLLAVGRLVEKKGFTYLLRACRLLKDRGYAFTCRIVGEGPLRQSLEQEIVELEVSDRVELVGAVPHADVIALYQQASIVTLPCIIGQNGDRDGIPNVLVEAMAMGKPVVSTPVSGIPELITSDVNGLLVAERDGEMLADALALLLDTPEVAQRLAIAGRQTVQERFDMEHNTRHLQHLFCAEGKMV